MIDINLCEFSLDKNVICFEIVHPDCIAASLYKIDQNLNSNQLINILVQFFKELHTQYPNVETVLNHPGTYNPRFAKVIYLAAKKYGSDFLILHNSEIVNVDVIDSLSIYSENSWDCQLNKQYGIFNFIVSLHQNKSVQTPYRWYVLDSDGFAIDECIEKPDAPKLYQSLRLRDKYKKYRIQITDRLRVKLHPK